MKRRDREFEWAVAKAIATMVAMCIVGGLFIWALFWWVDHP